MKLPALLRSRRTGLVLLALLLVGALAFVALRTGPLAPTRITEERIAQVAFDRVPEVVPIGELAEVTLVPSELSAASSSASRSHARWPTPVILADEPTAPLDSERALAVVGLLEQMAHQYATAIIVVTHDEKIIPTFRRLCNIRDGRTVEEVQMAKAAWWRQRNGKAA